jgi:uncharacterized delta-60 repeat protein
MLQAGDPDGTFGSGGIVLTNRFGDGINPPDRDEVGRSVAIYDPVLFPANANKIVVGGWSSNGSNNDFALARYLPNGTLDPTFGGDGKVILPIGNGHDEIYAILIQPTDGRIVAAGRTQNSIGEWDFALVRFLDNGTPDPDFDGLTNANGIITTDVQFDDELRGVAWQSGKIIVAGSTNTSQNNPKDFVVARYQTTGMPGALDTTFGNSGIRITGSFAGVGNPDEQAFAVAVHTNNHIVAAGTALNPAGSNGYDFAIARYTPDGAPVGTFGNNGRVVVPFGGNTRDEAHGVVFQPDGKIVAVGWSGTNAGVGDFALVRLHATGLLDNTFDGEFQGDGKFTTRFGAGDDRAQSVVLQADQKIVVAGYSSGQFALARYLPSNGKLDTTFGSNGDGTVTTDIRAGVDEGHDVALQADGKIVVAGFSTFATNNRDFAVVRYLGSNPLAPAEITVRGRNGLEIVDGDNTPETRDGTDFGVVAPNAPMPTQTFTIHNDGAAPLTVTSVTVSGTDFSLTAPWVSTVIGPSGMQSFTVQMNTAPPGVKMGTVTIVNDDGDENPYTFDLKGLVALQPEITVLGTSNIEIVDNDTTPDLSDGTDFGTALVNALVARTFTIRNDGTANLNVTSVTASGDFTVTPAWVAMVIPPNQSRQFTVVMNTSTAGAKTGTVTITSDDADENPYTFSLQGNVSGSAEIKVEGLGNEIINNDASPDPADGTDFGTVLVNSPPVDRIFTIRNTGGAPLTINSVRVDGNFTLVSGLTNTVIPSNGVQTITVRMTTTTAGAKTGQVVIRSTDADEEPYIFQLAGNVVTGFADIEVRGTNSLVIIDGDPFPQPADGTDFGTVAPNASATRTFAIHNTGTAALSVSSVTVTGTDFIVTPAWNPSPNINPNSFRVFTVQMITTTTGAKTGTVTIVNSDTVGGENPYTFALAGNVQSAATPEDIEVRGNGFVIVDTDPSPSPIDGTDFGTVALNATATRTFAIHNTGTAALTINSVTFSNGDFSLLGAFPLSVPGNSSATFTVQMNTTTAGAKTATVTIGSSDPDAENPYTFALAGNVQAGATPEDIEVRGNGFVIVDGDPSPSPIDGTDFGTVALNATATRTFAIHNTGTAALTINSVTFSNGNFSLLGAFPLSVPGSSSATFTVRMNTTTVGAKTGIVTIGSSDPDAENPYTFALAGNVTTTGGGSRAEIRVLGNGVSIKDGDTTPTTADHTDFGIVAMIRTFTIRNDGPDTLTVGTVSVPAGFTVTAQPATSVAPFGMTQFTVRLNPGPGGIKLGDVTFATNDTDENPFNFRIRGILGPTMMRTSGSSLAAGGMTPTTAKVAAQSTASASGSAAKTLLVDLETANSGTKSGATNDAPVVNSGAPETSEFAAVDAAFETIDPRRGTVVAWK